MSSAVRDYVLRSPVERGKWQLMHLTEPLLFNNIGDDLYVRVLDYRDPVEREVFLRGVPEPRELAVFGSLTAPGMTVLDVGANMGTYTMIAAKKVGPSGRVYAFEPTPGVASRLRLHVEDNQLSNVTVVEAAVSDHEGTLTFYLQESCDMNSLISKNGKPIQVRTCTLDEYIASQGISKVDVLKIDVEGAESMVLEGARRLISGPSAPMVLIEFNPAALERAGSSAAKLESVLRSCGYRCHTLADHGGGIYWNVLALRPEHIRPAGLN